MTGKNIDDLQEVAVEDSPEQGHRDGPRKHLEVAVEDGVDVDVDFRGWRRDQFGGGQREGCSRGGIEQVAESVGEGFAHSSDGFEALVDQRRQEFSVLVGDRCELLRHGAFEPCMVLPGLGRQAAPFVGEVLGKVDLQPGDRPGDGSRQVSLRRLFDGALDLS